jgi:hypothetical protein
MIAERKANGETAAALAREFEVGEATVWRDAGRLTADNFGVAARTNGNVDFPVHNASGAKRPFGQDIAPSFA